MNNARMWLVVSPTVGLPLFLTGVALTSLTVHHYVLANTAWFGAYWSGQSVNEVTAAVTADETVNTADSTAPAKIYFPDGRTATVVFDTPVTVAAAASVPLESAPPPD